MKEKAGKKHVLYSIFVPHNSWRLAKDFVHIARVVPDTEPGKITLTISKFDAHNTEREAIESDTLRINCDPAMRDTIIRTIKLQAYLDGLHRKSLIRDRKDRSGGSVLKRLDDYDCHGLVLRACGLLTNPVINKFRISGETPATIMNAIRKYSLGLDFKDIDELKCVLSHDITKPAIVSYYRRSEPIHSMLHLGVSQVFGHVVYHKVGWGIGDIYKWGFRFENMHEAFCGYDYYLDSSSRIKVFAPEELQQAVDEHLKEK